MPYDFKKEMKDIYAPKARPSIVTVPPARFIAHAGQGDPNEEDGAYQQAISVLYAIAYTLKMSPRSGYEIPGFYDWVVPPLESFWQPGALASEDKSAFCWLAAIRLPDFVTESAFAWAQAAASQKKKLDCSAARYQLIDEGPCVQMLHIGPYDTEPQTLAQMDAYIKEGGFENDISPQRPHHEIYLTNPRRTAPEKWKTILRHPIRPKK